MGLWTNTQRKGVKAMAERLPLLPMNARFLGSQLENEMETWRQRRLGESRREFRHAATTAMDLSSAIISEFQLFHASLERELAVYDEAARKGET
jgi:hypothetical protein